jgi:hypothetical protein
MHTLADASSGAIVAPHDHVAPKASHTTEIRSPRPRSATDPASATRPLHTTTRKVRIAGRHSFLRRGVVLKGLFGIIVLVALPSSEYVAHHGVPPAVRVSPKLIAKVLPIGASSDASPSSAAFLEAQSVIERWFVLPQPPGAAAATSAVSQIKIPRIFPTR